MAIKKSIFSLPTAKRNLAGQIISNPEELKQVYLEHFTYRMRERSILPNLEEYKNGIDRSFKDILNITQSQRFPNWSISDLDNVLKTLKRRQDKTRQDKKRQDNTIQDKTR